MDPSSKYMMSFQPAMSAGPGPEPSKFKLLWRGQYEIIDHLYRDLAQAGLSKSETTPWYSPSYREVRQRLAAVLGTQLSLSCGSELSVDQLKVAHTIVSTALAGFDELWRRAHAYSEQDLEDLKQTALDQEQAIADPDQNASPHRMDPRQHAEEYAAFQIHAMLLKHLNRLEWVIPRLDVAGKPATSQ